MEYDIEQFGEQWCITTDEGIVIADFESYDMCFRAYKQLLECQDDAANEDYEDFL